LWAPSSTSWFARIAGGLEAQKVVSVDLLHRVEELINLSL
jgi:hypothetical protein